MQHGNSGQTASPSPAIRPGQMIPWTSPDGSISITVHCPREGVFKVTTYQRTLRLERYSPKPVGSEGEARDIARGYALLARAGKLAAEVTA